MATPSSSQTDRALKRKHDDDRVHSSSDEETFDFTKKTWMSDIVFVVEGKRLYASKSILGLRSPVFRAMFGSDFSERNKTEVELPEKQYSDFLQFLQFLVPYRSKEISIGDCMVILPLVNEYQVDDLLKKCESVLQDSLTTMSFNNELLIQLFQLADRCNLKSVVECIANKLSLIDPKQLAQDLEVNLISSDLRQKLMERYFDRYQECQSELVQYSLNLDVPVNTGDFENAKGAKVKLAADISECTVLLDERKKVLSTTWFLLWNMRAAVSCLLFTSQPEKNLCLSWHLSLAYCKLNSPTGRVKQKSNFLCGVIIHH